MQEFSAGVVVVCNDEFLLLHHDIGHWDLPKGHIEKGESVEQAALRELVEETGIKNIFLVPNFSERIHYFFKREGKLISKDVIFLLGKVDSKEVVLSDEHDDFVWLPVEQAVEKVTYKTAKEVLQKASAFLK